MKRLLSLLLALCLPLCAACADEPAEGVLRAIFFDAGKADAILIQAGGKNMLIDAGLNKFGKELVRRLPELGVEKIDVLVVTHFDKDHVGGADRVVDAFPVGTVYQPVYEKESKQKKQYLEALDAAGIEPVGVTDSLEFEFAGTLCRIDAANRDCYGEDEENDFSLVLSLEWGGTSFLFAGDAEEARIDELLDEGAAAHTFLKVPHHGRWHANNAEFFDAVSPQYAVVTCSADEPEDARTVSALEACGAEVLFTRLGDVTVLSDGSTLSVTQ